MKIASIQMTVVEGDKTATIDKALGLIDKAAPGSDLVMLPEIWNVGFMSFDRYLPEAEEEDGPTLTSLKAAARQAEIHIHTGSFVFREGERCYNSSFLISPGGEILARYDKVHLFGYNSRETQLLTPGRDITVVQTDLGRLGLATCYDLRFPELFRRMVDAGAETFLICSAWPYPRLESWLMCNRIRAIENQAFLVSANSCGPNLGATFTGHSMAVDPWGVILASAGDEETIVRAELDPALLEDARQRFPALADRRDWLR